MADPLWPCTVPIGDPCSRATAMEYKSVRFEIMQTANPHRWKWVVFLDATRMQTGIALTRADAVLDADVRYR